MQCTTFRQQRKVDDTEGTAGTLEMMLITPPVALVNYNRFIILMN